MNRYIHVYIHVYKFLVWRQYLQIFLYFIEIYNATF